MIGVEILIMIYATDTALLGVSAEELHNIRKFGRLQKMKKFNLNMNVEYFCSDLCERMRGWRMKC